MVTRGHVGSRSGGAAISLRADARLVDTFVHERVGYILDEGSGAADEHMFRGRAGQLLEIVEQGAERSTVEATIQIGIAARSVARGGEALLRPA